MSRQWRRANYLRSYAESAKNGPVAANPNSTSYVERSGGAEKSQIAALFEVPSSIPRTGSICPKDLPSDASRSIGENPERVHFRRHGYCHRQQSIEKAVLPLPTLRPELGRHRGAGRRLTEVGAGNRFTIIGRPTDGSSIYASSHTTTMLDERQAVQIAGKRLAAPQQIGDLGHGNHCAS